VDVVFLIGRILFAAVFLCSGLTVHLLQARQGIEYARMYRVPMAQVACRLRASSQCSADSQSHSALGWPRRLAIALFVAGLRAGRAVAQSLEEDVRVGLEPDDFAEACRLGEVGDEGHLHSWAATSGANAFRRWLLAIRLSQVRIEARASKLPSPCQPASNVSCSASSASSVEPRIR
jgi:hypothetical protein